MEAREPMPKAETTADMHETFLSQVNEAIGRMTLGGAERPTRPANAPRIKTIVVAYDGSKGARRALAWADDLARSYGASVTVAGVSTPPQIVDAGITGYAWYGDYTGALLDAKSSVRKAAEGAVETLRDDNVEAESVVVEGPPGREIASLAAQKHADLVIAGATRMDRVARALLGSTATTLLDRAPCSVLLARGDPRPQRILVATDGSHASYRAVAIAFHRASQTGAELVVQHVLDYPTQIADEPPEGFLKAVVEHLRLPAAPPRVRYVLDVGSPAENILLRGGEEGAGLVVLGSQGKGALERFFVGSTSRRVANESHASVLVVKDA